MGLVECHSAPGTQGVGSNFVGVEAELLEADLPRCLAEVVDNVGACDGLRCGAWGGVVDTDGRVKGGIVLAEMDVPARPRGDGVPVEEPGGLMRGRLPPDTILLRVQVEGDGESRKEASIWGVPWDDAVRVMELHVPEAELGGASVRIGLGIFAGAKAEEEGQDNEVRPALGEGVDCGGGHREHDEAEGDGLLSSCGGVLVPPVAEHAGEPLVQIAAAGSRRLPGVGAAFQKVDLGDSAPRRSNRVCPNAGHPRGKISVTDPDAIHLKDLDKGDVRVLEGVVNLLVGAEVHPVPVFLGSFFTGDMSATNATLRNAEITQEIISGGGWHARQEPGDWRGE